MKPEDITLDWLHARVVERDGCLIWNGTLSGGGRHPVCKVSGRTTQVRRLIWELSHGRSVPKGLKATCNCNQALCLHPDHVVVKPEGSARIGRAMPMATRIKLSMSKRNKSEITDELVQQIRISTEPVRATSEKLGVSMSYVAAIRRNEWRRDYSNPFAGLGQ